ncbi:response regulator [Mesobacterium pallidum]|uniref:response regulator n=1 Tax=Mesobacterium pallidum TaxID=2872037 RepID=UPI001EE2EF2B
MNWPFPVVADITMPRMTGVELPEALRAEWPWQDRVVFVLSSSDSRVDIARAYAARATGDLLKPTSSDGHTSIMRWLQDCWSACEPLLLRA